MVLPGPYNEGSKRDSAFLPAVAAGIAAASLLVAGCSSTPDEGASATGASEHSQQSTPDTPQTPDESDVSSSDSDTDSSATPNEPEANLSDEKDATLPVNVDQWIDGPTHQESAPVEGSQLIFHDMRVGEHENFYRFVIEFSGEGLPGWYVDRAAQPLEQGRGLPLKIRGATFLDVGIEGTAMPLEEEDQNVYYSGPPLLNIGPLSIIEDGTFEGRTHVVIGMDQQRVYQIGILEDPMRVVIDIRK